MKQRKINGKVSVHSTKKYIAVTYCHCQDGSLVKCIGEPGRLEGGWSKPLGSNTFPHAIPTQSPFLPSTSSSSSSPRPWSANVYRLTNKLLMVKLPSARREQNVWGQCTYFVLTLNCVAYFI